MAFTHPIADTRQHTYIRRQRPHTALRPSPHHSQQTNALAAQCCHQQHHHNLHTPVGVPEGVTLARDRRIVTSSGSKRDELAAAWPLRNRSIVITPRPAPARLPSRHLRWPTGSSTSAAAAAPTRCTCPAASRCCPAACGCALPAAGACCCC
jgi:hypothetical protein